MKKWFWFVFVPFFCMADEPASEPEVTEKINILGSTQTACWVNMDTPYANATVRGNTFMYGVRAFYDLHDPKHHIESYISFFVADGSNDFRLCGDDGNASPSNEGTLKFLEVRVDSGYEFTLEDVMMTPRLMVTLANFEANRTQNSIKTKYLLMGMNCKLETPIRSWYTVSLTPGIFLSDIFEERFGERDVWMQQTEYVYPKTNSRSIGAELQGAASFRFGAENQYVIQVNPFIQALRFDQRFFMYGVGLTAGYAF